MPVYIIRAGQTDFVKIGWCTRPFHRERIAEAMRKSWQEPANFQQQRARKRLNGITPENQ